MTVAGFIASQRTEYGVPHAVACRALEVSESWFYKWHDRPPTDRDRRRAELDAAVKKFFDASGGTYGSPRIFDDGRGRLEGVGEQRGGLDATPGAGGPAEAAA